MTTKIDKSLLEVWEMKQSVYQDFIQSNSKNFNDFIRNDVRNTMKKFNIKFKMELENNVKS